MNGYNFTDRLRKVLQMAREEATRLHHEYVGTEHLLLGLLREGEGVAAAVLANLGVEREAIRRQIEQVVKAGKAVAADGPELPYTSRAKKALELAMMAARELNHSYVGTEHLLLGLLREEKGIAAQVLVHSGVTLSRVTAALGTVTNTNEESTPTLDLPERPGRMVDVTDLSRATTPGGPLAKLALIIAIVALVVAVLALVLVVR